MATKKKVVKKPVAKKVAPKVAVAKKAVAKKKVVAKKVVVTQNLPGVYRTGRKIDGIFGHPRFVPVLAVALFAVTIVSIFGVLGSSAAPVTGNCFIQEDGQYRLVDGNGMLTDETISMLDKTPNVQELLCEF